MKSHTHKGVTLYSTEREKCPVLAISGDILRDMRDSALG